MTLDSILKKSAIALALTMTPTAALAHDYWDCKLGGEVVCDEIATSPAGWENCAQIVAIDCFGHTHKTASDGAINTIQAQRLDREVEQSIRQKYIQVSKDPQLLQRMQREYKQLPSRQ